MNRREKRRKNSVCRSPTITLKGFMPLTRTQTFDCFYNNLIAANSLVGSVVEWLKRRTYGQHGLGSKPLRAILLCPWERHFTALSPAGWS